jgi:hypothetical protein
VSVPNRLDQLNTELKDLNDRILAEIQNYRTAFHVLTDGAAPPAVNSRALVPAAGVTYAVRKPVPTPPAYLSVRVIEARGLQNSEWGESADSYTIVTFNGQQKRTKVASNNL